MSFWSGLGNILKVAAPIAAGFIPGVGPLAAMGIGALTDGGINIAQGGGIKGAITGGLEGAAGGYGGSQLNGSFNDGAGLFGGGSSVADSGPLPLAGGFTPTASAGTGAATTNSGIGSTLSKLLLGSGGATTPGQTGGTTGLLQSLLSGQGMSALGKGLGGVAQSDATNRGVKLQAMIAGDQSKLAEQQQRNQDLATLPGQIEKADYIASGGYKPKQNFSSNGRAIPTFDLGLKPLSANDQAMGQSLENQLTTRLNTAPTYNDYSSMMNPSSTETALDWASPVLSALGASKTPDPTTTLLAQLLKPQTQTMAAPTVPSIVPPKPIVPTAPTLPQVPITGTDMGPFG